MALTKSIALTLCAIILGACAQGGRVAMGKTYVPVRADTVQILFQAPAWQYEQIGIVSSQGAQVASDATVYKELQSQAAKLGADAVLIISSGMRQYAYMPGMSTYNAYGGANIYGNNQWVGGNARYQANAVSIGPHAFVGLNVQGIALKRVASQPVQESAQKVAHN
jgi:hypothetical protein